ncbi:hypothetical protein BOKEGFJH_00016 [Chlamydia avium]|uniref:Lipoprotein n=1 Tax=Chlamydia avium 10DC88 TaxID=1229831 RepID=W8JKR8_9CHLA|nr:hypothetical protein M832_00150 [Chlamydia avium 10DC88]VVT42509.1 hypothetical protein BOKEGFJH_00016 [Chlamydia avium]
MKRFSFLYGIFLISLFISSCDYVPPPREYILTYKNTPLTKQAHFIGFSIAKSVFYASYDNMCSTNHSWQMLRSALLAPDFRNLFL